MIDPEGAEVVRHIYSLRKEGTSINDIAKLLKREKILIPSVYALRKGFRKPTKQAVRGEELWDTKGGLHNGKLKERTKEQCNEGVLVREKMLYFWHIVWQYPASASGVKKRFPPNGEVDTNNGRTPAAVCDFAWPE